MAKEISNDNQNQNELTPSNEFIEESICLLIERPEDNDTLRKQKIFAKFLINKLLNEEKSINFDPELKNIMEIICKKHIENENIPGHIIFDESDLNQNLAKLYEERLNQFKECKRIILSNDKITNFIKFAKNKIQSLTVIDDVNNMVSELSKLSAETLQSDAVDKFEKIIQQYYIKVVDNKLLEEENQIIISKKSIQKNIIQTVSSMAVARTKISSGFKKLDELLNGNGFESTRIYVFGGKPGLGKSALLMNFLVNNTKMNDTHDSSIVFKRDKLDKEDAIVYITLENDIVETTERLARIITKSEVKISNLDNSSLLNIQSKIDEVLNKNIILKYMQPYNTTTMDIFLYIDQIEQRYNIKTIYIDYLNLVSSVQSKRGIEKRHELGMVTAELKILAKRFNCPVIIPTQLNTAGYEGIPSMRNLDESRQIAQNSDFIGLLFEIPINKISNNFLSKINLHKNKLYGKDYSLIGINIDKNRNGGKDLIVLHYTSGLFKFSDISEITNNISDADIKHLIADVKNSKTDYDNSEYLSNEYYKNDNDNSKFVKQTNNFNQPPSNVYPDNLVAPPVINQEEKMVNTPPD